MVPIIAKYSFWDTYEEKILLSIYFLSIWEHHFQIFQHLYNSWYEYHQLMQRFRAPYPKIFHLG